MIRLGRIAVVVIALVAGQARAAPPLQIGAPFSIAPATAEAVAYDGTNYLVVWSNGAGVVAARVSPSGAVLAPGAFLVSPLSLGSDMASHAYRISVAYTQGVYLVAWLQWSSVSSETGARSHYYYARVGKQGNVLDATPGLLTTSETCYDVGNCEYAHPNVVVGQDGTNFLISGVFYFSNHFEAVLSPTGALLSYKTDTFDVGAQAIAAIGTGYYLIACTGPFMPTIHGTRLASDGTITAPELVFTPSTFLPSCSTSLASSGDLLLASWMDFAPTESGSSGSWAYRGRVNANGQLLDRVALGPVGGSQQPLVATVYDGCNFVTTWNGRGVRVAADGTQLDTTPFTLLGPVSAMASDGAGTVLVLSGGSAQLLRTCTPAASPVFDPLPSPLVEAKNAQGSVVSFTVTARDTSGPAVVTCTPASGSVFPLGTSSVLCVARDATAPALTSSASFHVVVRDTTPPTLLVPSSVVANAVAPKGTTVSFTVTATDLVDPSPTISCKPASGSLFPVGATNVTCKASDAKGNVSPSKTFPVLVKGAPEQLKDLLALLESMSINSAVKGVLRADLQRTQAALKDGTATGRCKACDQLSAFISEVNAVQGPIIPKKQAQQLITGAATIKAALACPSTTPACGT